MKLEMLTNPKEKNDIWTEMREDLARLRSLMEDNRRLVAENCSYLAVRGVILNNSTHE